jgi:hypothetical protein
MLSLVFCFGYGVLKVDMCFLGWILILILQVIDLDDVAWVNAKVSNCGLEKQIPFGMTTRKATARTTATANTGILHFVQNDDRGEERDRG